MCPPPGAPERFQPGDYFYLLDNVGHIKRDDLPEIQTCSLCKPAMLCTRAEHAVAVSALKASIVDGDLSARGPTVQT